MYVTYRSITEILGSESDLYTPNQRLKNKTHALHEAGPTIKQHHLSSDLKFLSGGGEMGRLTREFDWSSTSIGPAASWPQSLKTALAIILATRYPMLIWWGPELIHFYNDAYIPVLGKRHPSALGQCGAEVWAEIWHQVGPQADAVIKEGKSSWNEELLIVMTRNDYLEEVYMTFSYGPILDDNGKVGGVFCACTEETQRVLGHRRLKTLQALADQTAQTKSVNAACEASINALKNNPHDLPFALLYLFDADEKILSLTSATGVNPGTAASPHKVVLNEDASPWPFSQALVSGALDFMLSGILTGLPGGPWPEPSQHAMVLPITHPGQTQLAGILIAGVSPRRPLDEAYKGFFSLVTQQVASAIASARAYEEERRRAEMLAELDRAKTAFFSNISHEFRTPLTLLLGPIEDLLADRDTAPLHKGHLEIAHRNALRMLKLVNNLLDFSRIEAGRADANYQPTNLAALTTELASSFRSACERAGLNFIVDCQRLDEDVYIDHDMWEKIVLNLISNAFKFTAEGEIRVMLQTDTEHVHLMVSDTGVGIPAEELPHIFERFHRVTTTRGRTHEGTGIGLSLVRELVKLHGGEVKVKSRLGKGSQFKITIPLGTAHLDPQYLNKDSASLSSPRATMAYVEEALRWLPHAKHNTNTFEEIPPEAFDMPLGRARILWVDDNADMRDYVSRLLNGRFDVEAVSDGIAALEAIARNPPDLILSDIMMPGLDGLGLLATLRADPATRDLPVILLSARAGEERRIEGMQAGADDYLIKPFSARELLARVETHVKMARARKASAEAVARRSEQFETLFKCSPYGMYLVDSDLRIRAINQAARPLFYDVPGTLVGQELAEVIRPLVDPLHHEAIMHIFRHTLETGKSYASPEWEEPGPNGDKIRVYEWRVDRIQLAESGNGLVCYARDISEQVHQRETLRDVNRRKDEFVATLAHELRNPLMPIRTAAELLRRFSADEHQVHSLAGMIDRQITHMARLLDDLLNVSQVMQGKISLQRKLISVTTFLQHAVETSRSLIESRQHELKVELDNENLHVRGDLIRLTQVVANLLNNAAKYTPKGGKITLHAYADGNNLIIQVKDNGIGIAPNLLASVFELFVQAEPGAEYSLGGLGIGLTLVRKLIELHNGTVSAASNGIGQGALFTIRLPLATKQKDTPTMYTLDTNNKLLHRVLIVEDNKDAGESLSMLLKMAGHEVHWASTGVSALEVDEKVQPNIVLCDLGLPGNMSGFDVARILRARARPVTLVAMSGYGQDKDRVLALQAGFERHLTKPVDFQVIEQLLANSSIAMN